uniref:Protein kinase domain-containing protein n=1 Tax=Acrobeloides nanus TaxID=290746 RepID=A0A914DGV1_9BILA
MRYYRAPEVVLGIDEERHESCMLYDRKVDIWSAGCILAEMITGKPLFPGTNNLEQWNKIVQVVGSPNQSYIQQLPEGIKNFVEQSPRYEPKSWTEIIPDSEFPQAQAHKQYSLPRCNAHAARDLLSKLLVIDPATRISVDQALEHPYVMWQHEPGELENETNPFQHYNGYIEDLKLGENEWKTLIFAALKQYELMKAQGSDSSEQRHECEQLDVWSAGCIFAEMLLGNLLFKSDERLHSLVQWTKIIEVIGSPDADFINQIPIREIREYVETQPKYEVMPWEQLFPDSVFPPEPKNHQGDSSRRYPMCDPQNGRDLLSKMLIINPTLRISVDEALEHPYVMWKNDPGEKDTDTNPHRRYNGYIDNMNQTENEWKAIIFAEMKQYERDHDIFGTIVDAPDCESCKKYRCNCAICSGMSVNLETP